MDGRVIPSPPSPPLPCPLFARQSRENSLTEHRGREGEEEDKKNGWMENGRGGRGGIGSDRGRSGRGIPLYIMYNSTRRSRRVRTAGGSPDSSDQNGPFHLSRHTTTVYLLPDSLFGIKLVPILHGSVMVIRSPHPQFDPISSCHDPRSPSLNLKQIEQKLPYLFTCTAPSDPENS